ncbi:8-oxo-dGTP diphosphatase [Lysobacter sp. yr284]|uniref:Nudix family hydrolase n=1 Tax=Lysobacter sp. yr284 TaxID=1761791 RepID=UPI000897896B|nr:Nudix family hydrolase [Lysobacter sp. yr284]SDY63560.1 8-oxo-dGTP diphosphatase [Lysobacter sp. yr284]
MGSWADTAPGRDSGSGAGEAAQADPEPPAAAAAAVAGSRIPNPPSRRIEVVAGVVRDARGRVLLTRRTEGRDLAGLWEFPGGKREPGETAEAALSRELHEELGIDAEIGAELIRVPQIYPDKRLVLDVRHVRAWRGSARGREGQALAWVPPHKLASYAMPPADRPVVAALEQPERYLVTPEPADDGVWLAGLSAALAAGARRVQLRAPALAAADPARWRQLAAAAAQRCRAAKADLLINADLELARELSVGLHLRAAQLRGLGERPLASGLPLAASCHDADELRAAQALGCDFAVVGSVKPTPSHPSVLGIGWEAFAALRESVSLPIYAIGGLGPDDLDEARRHGAQGVAAIRSLWPA